MISDFPLRIISLINQARSLLHFRLIPCTNSRSHLSAQYHEALCRIGAKMFLLARQGQLAWAGAVRQRLAYARGLPPLLPLYEIAIVAR
jgi:hypothetical protein